ncbi:hypothetical protein D3C72_2305200 [compost metagenome]
MRLLSSAVSKALPRVALLWLRSMCRVGRIAARAAPTPGNDMMPKTLMPKLIQVTTSS